MKKEDETATENDGNKADKKIVSKYPFQLNPSHAKVASFLNQHRGKEVHTYQFRDAGMQTSIQRISELISRGAVIDKRYDDATDSAGELHHNVGHYTFHGWEVSIDE